MIVNKQAVFLLKVSKNSITFLFFKHKRVEHNVVKYWTWLGLDEETPRCQKERFFWDCFEMLMQPSQLWLCLTSNKPFSCSTNQPVKLIIHVMC